MSRGPEFRLVARNSGRSESGEARYARNQHSTRQDPIHQYTSSRMTRILRLTPSAQRCPREMSSARTVDRSVLKYGAVFTQIAASGRGPNRIARRKPPDPNARAFRTRKGNLSMKRCRPTWNPCVGYSMRVRVFEPLALESRSNSRLVLLILHLIFSGCARGREPFAHRLQAHLRRRTVLCCWVLRQPGAGTGWLHGGGQVESSWVESMARV